MNFSPVAEFRPHVVRLLFFFVVGLVLGTVGFWVMMFFGIALLAAGLITILLTSNTKTRVAWWGALCGTSVGLVATWIYLTLTQQPLL